MTKRQAAARMRLPPPGISEAEWTEISAIPGPRGRARLSGRKFYEVATAEEWIRELEEAPKRLPVSPVLPDEALRRENMYEDRA